MIHKTSFKTLLLATALGSAMAGSIMAGGAMANTTWAASPDTVAASMRAGSREVPVQPGEVTKLAISKAKPGQSFIVLRGAEVLSKDPVVADEKGAATFEFTVPKDAEYGNQPLTVVSENPAGVTFVDLKLSKVVPPMGQDGYALSTAKVGERAYQVALSQSGKLYVASARGKQSESELLVLNAQTLAQEASIEVAKDPKGGLIDVFGLGVDDKNDRIWATNTLNQTVTVYDAKTHKVLKVFPEGSVGHPRDAVVDTANDRAYVNDALTGTVVVFDATKMEEIGTLQFIAAGGKEGFGTMTLDLDAKAGRLYTLSRDSSYIGWADLKTGKTTTISVPEMRGGSGIAHDPTTGRIFVTGQESNNVLVLDAEGKVLADTYIGAGGISIVWDAKTNHIYAATRAGGTVSVLDVDGKLLANLPVGDLPNQLAVGPDGAVYAVTMYGTAKDKDDAGAVTKITPKE